MSTSAAHGSVGIVDHRQHAGMILASQLARTRVSPSVIGAVTPMAVPVARAVAERLQAPLALVLARTLAVPHCPTAPFGAIDEDGHCVLDYAVVAGLRLDTAEIAAARDLVRPELTVARTLYGGATLSAFLPASIVVLVQGAMEHGLLMEVAVRHAFRLGAEKIVVASAWASPAAAARFSDRDGVKLVCPWIADGPPPKTIPTEEGRPHPEPQVAIWLARHAAEAPAPRRRASDRLPAVS